MGKNEKETMTESESFQKQLFYYIGTSGALASIICLIYVMISNPDWRNLYIALTSCLYIIALIVISIYHTRERKTLVQEKYKAQLNTKEANIELERARLKIRQTAVLKKVFPILHSISHAFRHECEKLKYRPISHLDDLKDSKFLLSTVDLLKKAYDEVTDNTCAVSIKLHIAKQEILVPIARDAASAAQRGLFDNWEIGGYGETSVTSNTASRRIIVNGENFFLANNLINLKDKEGYENSRRDWPQVYQSTLVLPIRFYNETTQEKNIPALLSIDSKAINIFDNDVCIEMGAAVTDMLYTFFKHPDFDIKTFPKLSSS